MVDSDSERDPVEVLAAEFVARHRRGETPSVDEYVTKHPQWADRIRQLFPAVAAMERLKVRKQAGHDTSISLGIPVPEQLGDFRILKEIGRGGMGIVFEAVQVKLDRKVALKVLGKKFTSDPVFLARFRREAKSAAALNHPNIVQVYDIGEDKGLHFFAMEFVDGEDVRQRLARKGKLSLPEGLQIATKVARALQYAKGHNIVHRDIKPENVMINRQGQVKLTDLGLSK